AGLCTGQVVRQAHRKDLPTGVIPMRIAIFAGAASALALLTPAISATAAAPTNYRAVALEVERLEGQGPPLIFIPGLASGSWTWRADAERLSKRHSVYLVTVPGFDGHKSEPG